MDLTTAVRQPGYLKMLVLCGLLGVPVSLAALIFLALVNRLQSLLWSDLPSSFGWSQPPWWMVILFLAIGGALTALAMRLPGQGGHSPADGFATGGGTKPSYLPSILLAAIASLTFGAVLGPEAPLVAMGTGLTVLAGQRLSRGNPGALGMLSLSGAFAAVSAIFGNPIAAAVLLIEALSIGGAMLTVALLPGLLAGGIGYLVFTGVGGFAGLQVTKLELPQTPIGGHLGWLDLVWAMLLGLVGGLLAVGIRRLSGLTRDVASKYQPLFFIPAAGAVVGLVACGFALVTGGSVKEVLFSGESGIAQLADGSFNTGGGALILLVLAKSIGYGICLGSGFRGGPIFPSIFVGAALGVIAANLLPDCDPLAAFGAGMAATMAASLRLPLSTLVVVALLLGPSGMQTLPAIIIAVVIAVIVRGRADGGAAPAIAPDADIPLAIKHS